MRDRKRRGNSRYYLFFTLSLVGVIALVIGAWYALRHLPFLKLQKIEISGNTAIPDSLIARSCVDQIGQNLFKVPVKDIKKDIMKISRVKELKIRRQLLNTIKISVKEREGILYVKSQEGRLHPIDSEGIIMERYTSYYREDIPIYSSYYKDAQLKPGKQLKKRDISRILALHLKVMQQAPEYLAIISEYYMIDDTINIVDSRYGTRIILADDDIGTQLKRYQFVQDNGNINRRSVVDLRFENQVVVKEVNK
ncbi:MAG: FtsQ-type POTRA domain-containing protein [Candidatus Cloacimonetes bacterium]|jgi:cell division septal protein FtsQ|nr:FtsQ-type POTRA domain-containing protein [Candidatus Cloacimonadota bacterium]MCB5287214.1 FtsQ-type POTRA domain-containing protein [Candidatus Cloacimonadota bacterium]MCK9184861.1 FtsQ-type POTRA domain-containing protein [Candidatus Cloacimonadota bacterium]MCK9583324.1 FtsQ-type POTRA domain-containing protein [Candidatus Cloacimonadota bacterium]MDY0229535.1 FtsQ-type POTRA domain-containing protein [Candidatus Cloacimonadaceae bacterium]